MHQARLPRTGNPGNHNQFIFRDFKADVFQVVFGGVVYRDVVVHNLIFFAKMGIQFIIDDLLLMIYY